MNEMDIFRAAKWNNIGRVREYLDSGADPDIIDRSYNNNTALIYASSEGHTEIVELLLDRGADINITNDLGSTALMEASRNNRTEIIRLLLDRGADPNIRDDYGGTALISASIGNRRTDIVKMLLDNDADPNIQENYDGETALMQASYYGNTESVGLLLENDADPNIQCHSGETSLIMASSRGYINIVKMLLDNGADPNIHMLNGETALMIAKRREHDYIARLIRDHIRLQKVRQDLALVSFFNTRLGIDSPLNYLHESDIIKEITSKPRHYDPSINIRMMDERRRDKLTKARQRLASMRSMYSREGPISTVRYDPSIMEGISRHLSRMRPTPSVQTRLMLEDKDKKGGNKRSSRSSSRKKKNYTRRRKNKYYTRRT